ncbi:MAG: hypothetical protein LCH98_19210 [Actinobacteria bacterium]|nr:hypothetical protein [Actinomycetota bacterium]
MPTISTLLTPEAVDRARSFVERRARPLERARLAHLLDGGPLAAIADELTAFRSPDGGFGHALESDCRAPESNVLATLTALDILRQHGAPGDHPLVAGACDWLMGAVTRADNGLVVWPFIPPAAQASPHAPWWDQSRPGQLTETFQGFVANPGVALTAHLWRREACTPGAVSPALLDELTDQAVAVIRTGLRANEVNAHDALAHFAGEPAVPEPARAEALAYLSSVLPQRVMRRPEEFGSYGIHPLWVAPQPHHPLAAVLAAPLEVALDHTIASQDPDGSWAPFWDWSGAFPEEAEQAMTEWRGCLVVRNIAAHTAYGRIR